MRILKIKTLKEKLLKKTDEKFLESIGCCNCFGCRNLTQKDIQELLIKINEKQA